ncbi:hypothetical protein [Flindersiella endophytica]
MTSLGTAVADITPRWPVELAGFAGRQGSFEDVRSPLSAQVFAFGDGSLRAVLVCADLLWWGPDLVESLQSRIAVAYGLPRDAIVLHASHTHSAPQPGLTFSPLVGAGDPDYLGFVQDMVLDALASAVDGMEPITVSRGRGECGLGMNRRRANPDGTFGGADPDGPSDPEVTVVRLDTVSGHPRAVFVHYACHPVVTADQEAGPDFPGVLRARLETQFGDGVVVAFLQGCCGDIDPALLRDGQFRRGGQAELDELGGVLADAASSALTRLVPAGDLAVRSRSSVTNLPLHPPSLTQLASLRDSNDIWGDWSRHLLAHPELLVDKAPLRLTLLELTDELALLGFDAELTVAYGDYVKVRSSGRVLPIPYSNGMIGYIVTAEQVRQGGYEPDDSFPYVYRSGRFIAHVEGIVQSAIDDLLRDGK